MIHDRPEGRRIYYPINSEAVKKRKDLMASLKTMRKTVLPSLRSAFQSVTTSILAFRSHRLWSAVHGALQISV